LRLPLEIFLRAIKSLIFRLFKRFSGIMGVSKEGGISMMTQNADKKKINSNVLYD